MKKALGWIVFFAIVAIGGYLFYAKVYKPRITYATYRPTMGSIDNVVTGVGEIAAKNIYNITSQLGGKVEKIFIDEGKWVQKGDLVALIDPVDLPQKIASLQKQIEEVKLLQNATKKELGSLIAQKVLANKTYQRYLHLVKNHFVSQAEYDKAKATLDSITAQIQAKRLSIQAQSKKIASLQKELEALKAKLSRYKITSPIDGYVVAKKATISQTLLPGQPIFQVVRPDEVWVKTYIDERISTAIQPGQKAFITLRSSPAKHFVGSVKRIEPQADPVTLEKRIDVAFATLPKPFFLHEQAYVKIITHRYDDLYKIPLRLIHFGQTPAVWVYTNGKAHLQPIRIIARDEQYAGVEGIDAHTIILIPTKNKKTLHEGMRVYR